MLSSREGSIVLFFKENEWSCVDMISEEAKNKFINYKITKVFDKGPLMTLVYM